MKYRVSNGFETLGDPCATTFGTRAAAEAAAEELRAAIAATIAEWEIPYAGETSPTGRSDEIAAWAHAVSLASGAKYGAAAGAYIADTCVEIDEID